MLIERTLAEALAGGQEPRVRTGATGMHAYASEAGSCARKMSYDMMAERPGWTPSLTQAVAFRLGKNLEEAVLDAAKLQNSSLCRQVPWTLDGGLIAGVADGVYLHRATVTQVDTARMLWDELSPQVVEPAEDATVVMEVKSMAQTYFSRAQKYGPELGHILQASMGALALGGQWVHIVYISKGAKASESPVLEWLLPVDNEAANLARAEQLIAVAAAKSGVAAPPWQMGDLITRPHPKAPPCLWCNWVERCGSEPVDVDRLMEDRLSGSNHR